jgi:hypothetical protein
MNLAGLVLVLIVGFVYGWLPALLVFLVLCALRAVIR